MVLWYLDRYTQPPLSCNVTLTHHCWGSLFCIALFLYLWQNHLACSHCSGSEAPGALGFFFSLSIPLSEAWRCGRKARSVRRARLCSNTCLSQRSLEIKALQCTRRGHVWGAKGDFCPHWEAVSVCKQHDVWCEPLKVPISSQKHRHFTCTRFFHWGAGVVWYDVFVDIFYYVHKCVAC